MSNWFRVKTKLPIRGEKVICYYKSGAININELGCDDNEFDEYNILLDGDHVTHWRRLPSPPKVKSK